MIYGIRYWDDTLINFYYDFFKVESDRNHQMMSSIKLTIFTLVFLKSEGMSRVAFSKNV